MNVGLEIWGMWVENLHGAMDKGMVIQFGKGLTE